MPGNQHGLRLILNSLGTVGPWSKVQQRKSSHPAISVSLQPFRKYTTDRRQVSLSNLISLTSLSQTASSPTHFRSASSSRLTLTTTGGPRKVRAVYSCTREAPAWIFSKASCPLLTPPTPMMGILPAENTQQRQEGRCKDPGLHQASVPSPSKHRGLGKNPGSTHIQSHLALGEGVHLPDGLCRQISEWLPTQSSCLRAQSTLEANRATHCGVCDDQSIDAQLQCETEKQP